MLARGLAGLGRRVRAPFRFQSRAFAVQVMESGEQLQETLGGNPGKLVVIDWTASWCGPCKQIAPILESLSEEHEDVVFVKVDVDQLNEAAMQAGVEAMPTFHFIKDKELIAEFAGADSSKLANYIEEYK
mmetsp:Transcript_7646/g.8718  ORF Transcript_7646/g.8718 Transcript_7646/m.8718 type:complete len:130 (+) Transcript_7646:34-423(+)|eukprot:CAMPEP_0205824500 /NCGR_PEP_ID=MMETSP0206-20130828/21316_1 /ASSEMBLY_ACC=CAM_ASM_000279 /TAXON_ID=36767 /ORGANISM="Euplotes focardii, Strain TN1" /LENGTH=129 /DNA_ID=CAMNT_0053122707 /DNA_START=34 /DNA_END=423 /DNA_ORIENTATION=+